jgi:hypothetical protein
MAATKRRKRMGVIYDVPLDFETGQLDQLGKAICMAFRRVDDARRKLGLLSEQADRHLRA